MREAASDFRLVSTAGGNSRIRSREETEDKLSQGSVQSIHHQLFHTLELMRTALGLRTCLLLWLDESGRTLKVRESASENGDFCALVFPWAQPYWVRFFASKRPLSWRLPNRPFFRTITALKKGSGSCKGVRRRARVPGQTRPRGFGRRPNRGGRLFRRGSSESGRLGHAGYAHRSVRAGLPGGRAVQA